MIQIKYTPFAETFAPRSTPGAWYTHPLVLPQAIFLITVTILGAIALWMTQGHLTYVIDDAYIHLAMAKTLATSGTWGIDARGFTSSSSSLLWTLLLAGIFRIVGPGAVIPLIVNILAAGGVLWAAYRVMMKHTGSIRFTWWTLLAIVFLVPLPVLVFTGLEHSLQILIDVGLVFLAVDVLSTDRISIRQTAGLIVLAGLATFIRFEGAFLILVLAVMLLARKRIILAVGILAAGALPIVIYGLVSTGRGWLFFPNSVILKTEEFVWNLTGLRIFIRNFVMRFFRADSFHVYLLLGLLVGCLVYRLRWKQSLWRPLNSLLAIMAATTFLHLFFARAGWFFRYEAYLMTLGILALALSVYDYFPQPSPKTPVKGPRPRYRAVGTVFAVMTLILIGRSLVALSWTPIASRNIYQQQIQMARFVQRYYAGRPVALNDIGAVAYLSDAKVIDLCGLADLDFAKIWLQHMPTDNENDQLTQAKGMTVAIIYNHWFKRRIPRQWVPAGGWAIKGNVTCGGDKVIFYAPNPEAAKTLRRQLREFNPTLPNGVGSIVFN